MTGHVLDHGKHAPGEEPLGERPPHGRRPLRALRKRPRAYDRMGLRLGHVEDRRAIDGDPDLAQIAGDQAGDQAGGVLRLGRLRPRFDGAGGRIARPMRRSQPLDPPALLVDQHRRIGPPDAFAERTDERAQLIAIADIALEEDKAPRVTLPEEASLLRPEGEAGAAANERLRHRRRSPIWR